jgi:hypothetical protein
MTFSLGPIKVNEVKLGYSTLNKLDATRSSNSQRGNDHDATCVHDTMPARTKICCSREE